MDPWVISFFSICSSGKWLLSAIVWCNPISTDSAPPNGTQIFVSFASHRHTNGDVTGLLVWVCFFCFVWVCAAICSRSWNWQVCFTALLDGRKRAFPAVWFVFEIRFRLFSSLNTMQLKMCCFSVSFKSLCSQNPERVLAPNKKYMIVSNKSTIHPRGFPRWRVNSFQLQSIVKVPMEETTTNSSCFIIMSEFMKPFIFFWWLAVNILSSWSDISCWVSEFLQSEASPPRVIEWFSGCKYVICRCFFPPIFIEVNVWKRALFKIMLFDLSFFYSLIK